MATNNCLSTLSLRLKELRRASRKTQKTVADDLGIGRATYSRYESGNRQPTIETLLEIANYYGVMIDYLLGGNIKPLTIKEKTFDIIWSRYAKITSDNFNYEWYSGQVNNAMEFGIECTYKDEKKEWCIIPSIGWGHLEQKKFGREYPATLEGSWDACAWIDEQRIKMCEDLL